MLASRTYTLGSTRILDCDGIACIALSGILTAATIRELKTHTCALADDDPVVIADWSGVVIADTAAALVEAITGDGQHVMRQPVALVVTLAQVPVVRQFARLMTARGLSRPVFLTRVDAAAWCRRELAIRLDESLHQARYRGQSGGSLRSG